MKTLMAYEGEVCAISHVFHPSFSSAFHPFPNEVFGSPSPIFQFTFGGSVNLKGWASVNGASLDEGSELEEDMEATMVWDCRMIIRYLSAVSL
jgi:hypothetical protein